MRIAQVANFVHETSGGVRTPIEALGARYADAGHQVISIWPSARHHLTRDTRGRILVELPGVPLPASGGYHLFVRRRRLADLIGIRALVLGC